MEEGGGSCYAPANATFGSAATAGGGDSNKSGVEDIFALLILGLGHVVESNRPHTNGSGGRSGGGYYEATKKDMDHLG